MKHIKGKVKMGSYTNQRAIFAPWSHKVVIQDLYMNLFISCLIQLYTYSIYFSTNKYKYKLIETKAINNLYLYLTNK